jgi:hypothetical protein
VLQCLVLPVARIRATTVATAGVTEDPAVLPLLAAAGVTPRLHRASLRGIRDEVTVFEVPA